ncbi:efflux RND transporter periplasmic adaptor subunit [Bradyrhizobium sp. Arg68]|uniref:HlyD family secretion protein n=1 Tax=Bradyrhizobium ivorense TaxID=2511166 RepID=UPI001E2E08AF|nr:efflux RND transporter periplasmic adaptor subunit [Bradyrhizobium ivorense]MCC8935673.1 efflux RND transporter periplasmic adaptor subunit [Bradyrhizobium ivorense]
MSASSSAIRAIRWVVLAGVLLGLGTFLWFATRPPPLTVQGEVSANRVDISPRVNGRVAKLSANVGDTIKRGALLAELQSPQLSASLIATHAALAVAKADYDRVHSTRPEVIASRKADVAAAEADVVLTKETYDRQAHLITTGFTPQQKVDEATRNLEMATRRRDAAQAALDLAVKGASDEEKALAGAQVKQAEASLNQREVDVSELTILAPISGQITSRVAELGENFSPGAPLFSLIDMDDLWFTFNLREDLLAGLKVNDRFDVMVPALKSKSVPVRVTMINVQGQYATWRATRATGDFDLRTFEVRAKPLQPVDGLRPGMSAIAAWSARVH